MTISSTNNRVSYAGNGATVAFSFPYLFSADSDLVIVLTDAAGTETTKTLTTHYTVTGATNPAGGTVTMLTAPASGESLVIYRDPPLTQGVDLIENDPLPAATVEGAFDKLTMIAQRLKDIFSRAARLSDGDVSGASVTLPTPTANKLIGWDSLAMQLQNYGVADLSASVVSAYMQTLLDDANAAAARATLGAASASDLQTGATTFAAAGGTADAITATFSPAPTLTDGMTFAVRASAANATTTPTFAPNGNTARTITKFGGQALAAGDIYGAGHEMLLRYRASVPRYELLNPVGLPAASTATTKTGTSTGQAVTPAGLKGAISFSNCFTSSDQSITNGTVTTIAHGLGAAPTDIQVFLKCTNAAGADGFAQNEIIIKSWQSGSINTGYAVSADATNVYLIIGSAGITVPSKPAGAGVVITDSSYALIVKAWA